MKAVKLPEFVGPRAALTDWVLSNGISIIKPTHDYLLQNNYTQYEFSFFTCIQSIHIQHCKRQSKHITTSHTHPSAYICMWCVSVRER